MISLAPPARAGVEGHIATTLLREDYTVPKSPVTVGPWLRVPIFHFLLRAGAVAFYSTTGFTLNLDIR
jgi:hypothetical protein